MLHTKEVDPKRLLLKPYCEKSCSTCRIITCWFHRLIQGRPSTPYYRMGQRWDQYSASGHGCYACKTQIAQTRTIPRILFLGSLRNTGCFSEAPNPYERQGIFREPLCWCCDISVKNIWSIEILQLGLQPSAPTGSEWCHQLLLMYFPRCFWLDVYTFRGV